MSTHHFTLYGKSNTQLKGHEGQGQGKVAGGSGLRQDQQEGRWETVLKV